MKKWVRSKFEPGAKFPWFASFIVAAALFLCVVLVNMAKVLADSDLGYFRFTALSFPFTSWFCWILIKASREDLNRDSKK